MQGLWGQCFELELQKKPFGPYAQSYSVGLIPGLLQL